MKISKPMILLPGEGTDSIFYFRSIHDVFDIVELHVTISFGTLDSGAGMSSIE